MKLRWVGLHQIERLSGRCHRGRSYDAMCLRSRAGLELFHRRARRGCQIGHIDTDRELDADRPQARSMPHRSAGRTVGSCPGYCSANRP